jgi:hypothetical protein
VVPEDSAVAECPFGLFVLESDLGVVFLEQFSAVCPPPPQNMQKLQSFQHWCSAGVSLPFFPRILTKGLVEVEVGCKLEVEEVARGLLFLELGVEDKVLEDCV